MGAQLPLSIRSCFELGASRLGRALEVLEWPNGGKDAAPAEINVLINVAYYLGNLPKPFQLYSEGTAGKGRIDMMGFDGDTAIAIEAKGFGAINARSESIRNDLSRLYTFVPSLTEKLNQDLKPNQWWSGATSRWGIILISSFRGRAVADAWVAEDERVFREKMFTYSNPSEHPQIGSDGEASGFLALYRAIPVSCRGAAQITNAERWQDCGEGWLLWGAVPLPDV